MRDPCPPLAGARGRLAANRRGRRDGGDLRRGGQETVRLNRVVRPAARIVVLDPQGAVLLQRFSDGETSWWVCPGGGLDEGEDARNGACREAREELGLVDVELGPEIWTRRHVFPWRDEMLDQRERFFLLRVAERFEPRPDIGAERLLAEGVREQRWWTIEEIEGHRGAEFAPRRLASLLRDLLAAGPPSAPFDVGV